MIDDVAASLVQEVTDLLEVSHVGLYEFIWILRGNDSQESAEEQREIATRALAELLSVTSARLAWYVWPSETADRNATDYEPNPADWEKPCEARYLAVTLDALDGEHLQ